MKKRIYINELSAEQLGKVFDENAALRNDVREDAEESEFDSIGEHIGFFRTHLNNWQVSGSNFRDFMNVGQDVRAFAEGVRKAEENIVGYLENTETIDKLDALLSEVDALDPSDFLDEEDEPIGEDDYDEAYDVLMKEVYNIANELGHELVRGYNRAIDYVTGYDELRSYFIEFYAEERMDADICYVWEDFDGTVNYELFEDLTRSYKEER